MAEEGSLSERAYIRIRDRIISLELQPGAPIDEDKLMRDLKVGRTPVREAIKRLELESLVDIYPRRGTFVSEVQITDLAAISEIRVQLEGFAAALAAERFRPEDEQAFSALISKIQGATASSGPRLMALDANAHRLIYSTARNAYLRDTLERYFNLSYRIWHLAMPRLPDVTANIAQHHELLNAIRQHDARRAKKVASDHVEAFERMMRRIL
ncbi:MAG: GntR family transcriptional regulator [Solirubrobacterales bacterium]